jgi:hypothetical protein
MDAMAVILNALASGAAAAGQVTVSEAVKNAYHALKALIQRRFVEKPDAALVLTKHAQKPEVWEAPLREALLEARADCDEDIIKAAQKLISLLNPPQAGASKYHVDIAGSVQGFVQGDHAQVAMTFTDKPREP